MKTILTLTVGEFELVHDLLSLLIAAMGGSALFFLLSRKQVVERFQPLLLVAGIVSLIGCYHAIRFFHSWNEAFELAGNSYVASGHFFHEVYRYADWALTMPLLLVELVLVAPILKGQTAVLLKRLIGAALVSILFSYLGASNIGEHGALLLWSCWLLSLLPFLYIARILVGELSRKGVQQGAPGDRLFICARNLFLVAWAFYPLASLIALCSHGFGEVGLVTFLVGAGIADLISKCGVSFYVYRISLLRSRES
ncbi:MAG: bacteriorhodopsin [Verrucomicrobiota bacterium]